VLFRPLWMEGFLDFGPKAAPMIEVSRTLMKSEPELAELVEELDGLEVSMVEKGLGTRVEIRAGDGSGLSEADLEEVLDRLAEPQKQPFGSA
jgi:hypothetical protein